MSNTCVTQTGLNYITSAHSQGLFIGIKYWLPVYDYRIDPDIMIGNDALSAVSAVADDTESRSTPFGEVLWNCGTNAYELSDETSAVYVLSGFSETLSDAYTLLNSQQTKGPVPVNLSASTHSPIGNYYRGDSVSLSAMGYGAKWVFSTSAEAITGLTPDYYADKTKYYSVIDYHPIRETGYSYLKGNFRCRLSENVGSIRFNKIALYVVQYVDGVESDATPGFFGEAYITAPIKKSLFGEGFNEITIDAQVLLSATGSGNWDNIFYGSSADYWSKVPNGLHSSEKISIGTFTNANDEPSAMVEIGHTKTSNNAYEYIPHIRLEGRSPLYDYVSHLNMKLEPFSLLGINTSYLWLSADSPTMIIGPEGDGCAMFFGMTSHPIYNICFSGASSNNFYRNYNMLQTSDDYLKMNRHKIQFYDDTSSSATLYNTIYGADVVRDENDLMIQTKLGNVYILAGATNYAASTDSMYYRHLYSIADVEAENLTSNTNWLSASHVNIVGKAGVKEFGPLELNYIPQNGTIFTSANDSSMMSTKQRYMSIFSGIKGVGGCLSAYDINSWNTYYDVVLHTNRENRSNWNPIGEYIDVDSELFIAAGKTSIWGDVIPGISATFDLGSVTNKWADLHANSIYVATADKSQMKLSTIYGMQMFQYFPAATPTKRQTVLIPNTGNVRPDGITQEEVWLGNTGNLITYVYASNINVPNKFVADSNGVYGPSISGDNYYSNYGYYERRRTTRMGEWETVSSPFTYTPDGVTGFSVSNETVKYSIVGKTCVLYVSFKPTFSGTCNRLVISWVSSTIPNILNGFVALQRWGAVSGQYRGTVLPSSTTSLRLENDSTSTAITTNVQHSFVHIYEIE